MLFYRIELKCTLWLMESWCTLAVWYVLLLLNLIAILCFVEIRFWFMSFTRKKLFMWRACCSKGERSHLSCRVNEKEAAFMEYICEYWSKERKTSMAFEISFQLLFCMWCYGWSSEGGKLLRYMEGYLRQTVIKQLFLLRRVQARSWWVL